MARNITQAQQGERDTPLLNLRSDEGSPSAVRCDDGPGNVSQRRVLRMSDHDLFFTVANPILTMGMEKGKTMNEDDVDEVLPEDIARNAHDVLIQAWRARCSSGRPCLKRSMKDCWGGLALAGGIFHLLEILCSLISPLVIKSLVSYVDAENQNLVVGLFCATMFFLTPFLQTLLSSHFILRARRVGIRCYAASTCMIFDKILRLSQSAASSYGTGALVNIAQVDAQRLEMSVFHLNFMWSMPLQLVISVSLLYSYLGISAFMPVVLMALLIPFNNLLVKRIMVISRATNKFRDARVKTLTEVVHAMRLVKLLGWEDKVFDLVAKKRFDEMKTIGDLALWMVANILMWQAMPSFLPLVAFAPYVLLGGVMDPGTAFAALSLLDLMRTPLTLFPQALQVLAQVQVGVERIEKLLLAEEIVEVAETEVANGDMPAGFGLAQSDTSVFVRSTKALPVPDSENATAACVRDAQFRWSKAKEDDDEEQSGRIAKSCSQRYRQCMQRRQNTDVSDQQVSLASVVVDPVDATAPASLRVQLLDIAQGKFVIVVGSVGAGKSTLVSGLLNEVPMEAGRVALCGSVAYCSQVPWILQGTIRENILMGAHLDAERLAKVVETCALAQDLKELRDGMDTMIGERGINLSGGQKARISLARACYADASLYILDDPLSAVDMHVAKHLMDKCLGSKRGMLRSTTRILVTHQLQYMENADVILVVQNGVLVAARPPSEITRADLEEFGLGTNIAKSEEELRRQSSGREKEPEEKTKDSKQEPERAPQQDEEEREVGALSCAVWSAYARAMGLHVAAVLFVMYMVKNFTDLAATFYLSGWSAKENEAISDSVRDLSLYSCLNLVGVLFLAGRVLVFRYVSLKVSRNSHDRALWAILRSPMSFLDTTPAGRIVNRFSADLQKVDMDLRYNAAGFLDQILSMGLAIIVTASYVPFLLLLAPLLILYNYVQKRFRTAARELQRLFSRSKSPIFQGLDEAIVGVSTVRAYRRQSHFIRQNREQVETNVRMMMNLMCCNRWLAMRLRGIGIIPVAVITLVLVLQKHLTYLSFITITGATAGLILRYALQLTMSMEGILQSLTQMELSLVALERITGYANLQQEPTLVEDSDDLLVGWPTTGTIVFEDVVMRYRECLPPVLNGISFRIEGGTSVGVVGRTGAGKSSLLQALFRMCPLDAGTIRIDGQDISRMGLHTLRQRLAIIPQDPVGFTGSLRFNLDPFGEHADEEILAELEKVQLLDFVKSKEEGLAYHLASGGENLSVGQRQLMCAARAFLRTSSILVLDEATASVDFKTDELIQQVLRQEVTNRRLTTVTIAHRINTILGSDNVLIMDKGRVAEFGPTQELASDSSSKFFTFIHPESPQ